MFENFNAETAAGMGFSITDIAEWVEKLKAAMPKIKGFVPMLKQWEATIPKAPGEIVLYTAVARVDAGNPEKNIQPDPNKNTVIVYVNTAKPLGAEVTMPDGTVLPADTLIITAQHKRFDVGELADSMLSYIPG